MRPREVRDADGELIATVTKQPRRGIGCGTLIGLVMLAGTAYWLFELAWHGLFG